MVIYGWRAAHLKSANSQTATCPSCGTKGSLIFSAFSKHAHIFWIPIFPFGKTGGAECQHCKHAIEAKNMSRHLKDEYNHFKSTTQTPIWQFSGLVIIAALVSWGFYSSSQNDKENAAFFDDPQAGDVYEFKTETGNYSTMKIYEVAKDSIYMIPNEYETNKISGINDIDKEKNYADFNYGIARGDLQIMFEDGTIRDINR